MVRNPILFKDKFPGDRDIVKADTLNPETLAVALKGIDTAFYLIHAMGSKGHFEEEDRLSAQNFADAAKKAKVKKIIYLGGLIPSGESLSPHLKSRLEVGDILRSSGVNVITFRASIIIGSGSLSFELIRNLSERLPFMITPKWIYIKAQPISITDVISYLVQGIKLDINESHIFEIGGKEVVSYFDIIRIYCEFRELKRIIIPVPFLTPYFQAYG